MNSNQFRGFLFKNMQRAASGKLPAADGKNVASMAHATVQSVFAETRQAELALNLGNKAKAFGLLKIT